MGIVWRAVDERLERAVAVKQILTQPGLSETERATVRQRAMREAKNAARFQHPNAIVVFDIAEHDGDPVLVMEYLPSQSLSAILAERGPLPVPEVARIGEQVAAALVAAHRAGIVHRDIKPGNLLIDANGTCKITDFGISRASGDLTLTQTGLIGGTPAYLAPELARGADPTPASDVFALGATLFHAIEGLPPYGDNTNQLALLYAAANGQINPPQHAGQSTALLMSLLRTDPDERPSMGEARERLGALASGAAAPATPLAATAVSPAVSDGGGRKPAGAPWQREHQTPPPHQPTAAGAPAVASDEGGGGSRKPLLFAALGVLALAIAAVLVFTLGGDDEPAAGGGPTTSQQPTTTQSPSPSRETNAGGPVEWGAAGQLVGEFYGRPDWDDLTPTAQDVYGSEDEFDTYWEEHRLSGWSNARVPGANPDGSVDVHVNLDFGNGSAPYVVTVVNMGGDLLLDGDTRVDGAAAQ
ncbi:serine/threonine protein kinase [Saccharomonospora sp. CUA-673]|uniref:serine/threonine-protein kinase n=1 Tax=Saccharomonospora sp. CUA-673 TaxID=1904969 RepID=UPI00096706B3|nr:serine/threonine-protein kinase [Saccharomonospora sp. CUA-673]OLT43076.1 serine/threonine protein kinase [Saccharomonospora sp. CUA-673]